MGNSWGEFLGLKNWDLLVLNGTRHGRSAQDLTVEGVAVAMLDMQLDTRDSHELGYASLRLLTVRPGGGSSAQPTSHW